MAVRSCGRACHFFLNKNYGSHVRSVVSALHIPGYVAQAAVNIVTPVFDHIEKLTTVEKETIQRSLTARNSSFDLNSFISDWKNMKNLSLQRDAIEARRKEISQQMGDMMKSEGQPKSKTATRSRSVTEQMESQATSPEHREQMRLLKEEGTRMRTELKELMPHWWAAEEKAITLALSLPNVLHRETPVVDDVVKSYGCLSDLHEPVHPPSDGIHLVDHSPTAYYLQGEAALLELDWLSTFSQKWVDDGFHLISSPDFVKSVVVDGEIILLL